MSPKHDEFAAFIAAQRQSLGLTLEQVAEATGVSRSNVHYWESGKGVPVPTALGRLAEALDLTAQDLFTLAGYTDPTELPTVAPYLRAKYSHLPDAAVAEAEKFFRDLESRYGGDGGDRS